MRKNASNLIIAVSVVFAASIYFFFAFHLAPNSLVAIEKPVKAAISEKNETVTVVQSAVPQRPVAEIQQKVEVQQKIEKALHYINQKSRAPTGQLKISADFLQEHEAFNGTRWKILSKVKAVRNDKITENDIVVGQMNHFQLVELPAPDSQLSQFDRNSPTVVYETRLKKPGLVTGLIKVETEHKELLESSVRQMNARISDSFDQIQTYFVTSELSIFDLEKLYTQIKSLEFVKAAELDISDREYEKK